MKRVVLMVIPALICGVIFTSFGSINTQEVNSKIPYGYPVVRETATIGSGFGERIHPVTGEKRVHTGIDFVNNDNKEVFSTADGKVIKAEFGENGEGNYVIVEHSDEYTTFYSHLNKFTVKQGDIVVKGQVIGYIGKTGLATSEHLHYEIRKNGQAISPEEYLR